MAANPDGDGAPSSAFGSLLSSLPMLGGPGSKEESNRDGRQSQQKAGNRPNSKLQEHSTEKASQILSETQTLSTFF